MARESPGSPRFDVFVSYAHEDMTRVEPLVTTLRTEGFKVTWDRDIPAGANWHSYITGALDAASCVLPVWSVFSVVKDFVVSEARRANKRGVLVPVRVDEVEAPLGLDHIQWVDLAAWIAAGGGKIPDDLKTSILAML